MKKRSSSIPLLVIVAVIALVLGSFGTATAAGLTKSQVKKIATKVVKKKAKTLSVAYAANAGNATNLNGQPASAYQNLSYRYRIPGGGAATAAKEFSFPGLPAGKYLVDYDMIGVMGTGGATVVCWTHTTGGVGTAGELFSAGGNYAGTFGSSNAAGVVDVTAAGVQLHCQASAGTWTIYGQGDIAIQVGFTRLDTVNAGSMTVARQAVESSGKPGTISR